MAISLAAAIESRAVVPSLPRGIYCSKGMQHVRSRTMLFASLTVEPRNPKSNLRARTTDHLRSECCIIEHTFQDFTATVTVATATEPSKLL